MPVVSMINVHSSGRGHQVKGCEPNVLDRADRPTVTSVGLEPERAGPAPDFATPLS